MDTSGPPTAETPGSDPFVERPEARLATLTVEIASVADAGAIICATEDGSLLQRIRETAPEQRVVAATTNEETHRTLEEQGFEVVRLPARVASRIGQVARRGKRAGALFVLGDSDRVLERSRQLVMNPFRGHGEEERMATDPGIDDTLVELAKLDGGFIVRGDGLIRTAGAYLVADESGVEVPAGLGARHVAAAAITARTDATAVVVSETDGEVRVFADGELVLQMDPEFPVL